MKAWTENHAHPATEDEFVNYLRRRSREALAEYEKQHQPKKHWRLDRIAILASLTVFWTVFLLIIVALLG